MGNERIRGTTLDSEPQYGSFASPGALFVSVPKGWRLDVWGAPGSGNYSVTLTTRNGTAVGPFTANVGQGFCLDGDTLSKFAVAAFNSLVLWAIVRPGSPFTWPVVAVAAIGLTPVNLTEVAGITLDNVAPVLSVAEDSYGTITDDEFFGPTSIAAATVETTGTAGVAPVEVGQLIRFSLACGAVLATAADTLTYVALKGATSGFYYALAFAGEAVAGEVVAKTAEDINIVYRNQDTVAHSVHGSWGAATP